MRETAGGILGQLVGHGLEYGLGLLGTTVLLARAVARGGVSSRPASHGSRSWIVSAASVYRGDHRAERGSRAARGIWSEGRRAKQQREEVVAKKVRAKPKINAPRIEPIIEKVEVSARARA